MRRRLARRKSLASSSLVSLLALSLFAWPVVEVDPVNNLNIIDSINLILVRATYEWFFDVVNKQGIGSKMFKEKKVEVKMEYGGCVMSVPLRIWKRMKLLRNARILVINYAIQKHPNSHN